MKSKRTRSFVVVILLLAAAVVLYALVVRTPSVVTTEVVMPTPVPTGSAGDSNTEEGPLAADVTPETVQAAISTLSRAGSYSRTITTVDYWDGGSAETFLSVWAHNGDIRIRNELEGRNVLLLSGGTLYIWYDDGGDYYVGTGGEGDGDAYMRAVTYEELLDMPAEDIIDAGYTDFEGSRCIYAAYLTESFGYREVLYVDTDTGLLTGMETWDGEELIYRMTASAPDLTTPEADWFRSPAEDKK